MALSNWDTLAIGSDGKSIPGYYEFPNGVVVDIRKNWANLTKGEEHCSINYGDASMLGISVDAKRGPQNSIFVLCTGYDDKTKKYHFFAGIGCYGFGDRTEEYLKLQGIEDPEIKYPNGFWYSSFGGGSDDEYLGYSGGDGQTGEFKIVVDKDFELSPWVGVEKSTLDEFKAWLEATIEDWNNEKRTWFDSINWEELLRYNQGDMFFAEALGTDPQATTVGETETPVLMKMLDDKTEGQ